MSSKYCLQNSVGEESHLAIETSGHGALKENHWLDDGAYLMVKLLNKLASTRASGVGGGSKVLTDLVDSLEELLVTIEFRLTIDRVIHLKGGSFQDYGEAVLKHLENVTDIDPKLQNAPVNYEGLKMTSNMESSDLNWTLVPVNFRRELAKDVVELLTVLAMERNL
ncbi:hypothetical protein LOK49_LG08G01121 [Camellia lanceoleosa]|uniref:Uncharacterized protein n=1 Tax=Camellia lanceoleosa TaxID=1840588 RepID=A0ACC0GU52_9ERIC|nr:hypothetical protein LOK49_LG08G01121 [Camellia lanceoleosa]